MKKILIAAISVFWIDAAFSQLGLSQNYEHISTEKQLKSIKTMYHKSEDTTKTEGRVLMRKNFDLEGRLEKKYIYTFWDVVSYDHTTDYKYDSHGNLKEETEIQQILNYGKRDSEYIAIFGDDPINEKRQYTYDESNKLTKELTYSFGREGFDPNESPNNTIEYFYNEKGKLEKKVSSTPGGRITYENYIATYEYDEMGQKIKEIKKFTTSTENSIRTSSYSYNEHGLLATEKIEDTAIPRNNKHLKYEYDQNGHKTQVLRLLDNGQWETIREFFYDKKGRLIFKDDDTTYTYYENGLVKQEIWRSDRTNEVVHFSTTYEFHDE